MAFAIVVGSYRIDLTIILHPLRVRVNPKPREKPFKIEATLRRVAGAPFSFNLGNPISMMRLVRLRTNHPSQGYVAWILCVTRCIQAGGELV